MELKIKELNLEKDVVVQSGSSEDDVVNSTTLKLSGELHLEIKTEELVVTSSIHVCNISDKLLGELHDVLNRIENEFLSKEKLWVKEATYNFKGVNK